MKYCLITFRSVTPAQRGEGIIRRGGIECTLGRTPRWMEQQGCGYNLRIRHRDAPRCVQLLRANQVAFRKIYLLTENGEAEEMVL